MAAQTDVFQAETASATIRFGAQNPGHPWWSIADRMIEVLVGFSEPLLPSVRFALYTPSALQGARNNPIEVDRGELDVAITTPAATARMATQGTGIYDHAYPRLRAVANFPHVDYIVFMVDASTGLRNLRELAERRYPLKLVTGRKAQGQQDVLTFVVEEILKRHGASYEAIESWGGEVFYGGPTHVGGLLMRDGLANALFQEAQMAAVWHEIARSREVTLLPVDGPVIDDMAVSYGVGRAEIPSGRYPGLGGPVPTVDFSGWLVFCREDLPREYAHALARACEAVIPQLGDFEEVRRALRFPIDPAYLFTETAIPLHEGAALYARERGYIE